MSEEGSGRKFTKEVAAYFLIRLAIATGLLVLTILLVLPVLK